MVSAKTPQGRRWGLSILALLSFAFHAQTTSAGVVTDGTLNGGHGRTAVGQINITPADGKLAGRNLFHSFSSFQIQSSESVTFLGPSSVRNVIVRVTDRAGAGIDGTVAVADSMPGARLIIAAPGGITVGPSARFQTSGDLVLTTADQVSLGTGNTGAHFDARGGKSVLTTAPPAAFGFLARHPSGIRFNSTAEMTPNLGFAPGSILSLAGGGVTLNGVSLNVPGGAVQILGVGSSGQVGLSARGLVPPSVQFAAWGDVNLFGASQVTTGAEDATRPIANPGADAIWVHGANLVMGSSAVLGNSDDAGPRAVRVEMAGHITMADGAAIRSTAFGDQAGGDVFVNARSIALFGQGQSSSGNDGSLIESVSYGQGAGGDVAVHVDHDIRLEGGSEIHTTSHGGGNGGSLNVTAGGVISANGGHTGANFTTGIISNAPDDGLDGVTFGRLGDIRVQADRIEVTNAAIIGNLTRNRIRGGDVSVEANSIYLNGEGNRRVATGILTRSGDVDLRSDAGAAGNVVVRSGPLDIYSGAGIGSQTFTPAAGGSVRVDAADLLIDAQRTNLATGIDARTFFAGRHGANAGDIIVHAKTLQILNQSAAIIANTSGSGAAGNIDVSADRIIVDRVTPGPLADSNTGIGAQVEKGAAGRGGAVQVHAGSLVIRNTGRVSVTTLGAGPAGDLQIEAGNVLLESGGRIESDSNSSAPTATGGNLTVHASDSVQVLGGSQITAAARSARGGDISVGAGQSVIVQGSVAAPSAISSSVSGHFNGGNIQVAAPLFVRVTNAQISAKAGGNGGSVTIDPFILDLTIGGAIIASGGADGGNVTLNANSQAGVIFRGPSAIRTVHFTGVTGVNGSIVTGPANADVLNALARLPGSLSSVEARLQPQCTESASFSSFLTTGTGGLPYMIGFSTPAAGDDKSK